jgi:hypothetical protein
MSPTATPPAPDLLRPDTSAFLEQQAAILQDAPDNDTMVRQLLAAALRRISALEQQLAAAAPPGRPRPQPSLRHPILTLLREQPDGLTRPQIEEAMARARRHAAADGPRCLARADRGPLSPCARGAGGAGPGRGRPPAGTGGPAVFSHPGPPQAQRRPTP